MRFQSLRTWANEEGAGANRAQPLGFALGFLVCSHQFFGRYIGRSATSRLSIWWTDFSQKDADFFLCALRDLRA